MIQYQLSTVGKTWDQFLSENNLRHNQFCPSPLPKTRQKRRRPYVHEPSKIDSELNPKDARVNNPIPTKDSWCDLIENITIEIPVNPS